MQLVCRYGEASFQPYFYIFNNWFSFNNVLNEDFELYPTYADALAGDHSKRLMSCNYDDPGVGFARDCSGQGRGGNWIGRDTREYMSSTTACNQVMEGSGKTCNVNRFNNYNHEVYLESAGGPRRLIPSELGFNAPQCTRDTCGEYGV